MSIKLSSVKTKLDDILKKGMLLRVNEDFVETDRIYGNKLPKRIDKNDFVMFVGFAKSHRNLLSQGKTYNLLHGEVGVVTVSAIELRWCFDLLENERQKNEQ